MAVYILHVMILGILSSCPLAISTDQAVNNTTSCFGVYDIRPINLPTHHFILPQGTQCKDFCAALTACKTFMIVLYSLNECALFNETITEHVFVVTPSVKRELVLIGRDDCIRRQKFLTSVIEIQANKARNDGLVIEKVGQWLCAELGFDDQETATETARETATEESVAENHRLFWLKSCQYDWQITFLEAENHSGSRSCHPIQMSLKNMDLCITPGDELDILNNTTWAIPVPCNVSSSLRLCRVYHNYWSLKPQHSDGDLTTTTISTKPKVDEYDIPTFIPLSTFRLISRKHYKQTPCTNVSVANGTVQRHAGIPLLLAGETITVICEEGYGKNTKEDGHYLQQYTARCDGGLIEALECSPIERQGSQARCGTPHYGATPTLLILNFVTVQIGTKL